MRFRPRNHRDDNPEVFTQLVKINPYMARVYDYPELLIPHPTPDNFQQLWSSKIKAVSDTHSGKVHLEIGCGSGRYLIEWAQENPQDAFIGLELRYKRLVLAAKKIEQQTISNISLLPICRSRPSTLIKLRSSTTYYTHIPEHTPRRKTDHN